MIWDTILNMQQHCFGQQKEYKEELWQFKCLSWHKIFPFSSDNSLVVPLLWCCKKLRQGRVDLMGSRERKNGARFLEGTMLLLHNGTFIIYPSNRCCQRRKKLSFNWHLFIRKYPEEKRNKKWTCVCVTCVNAIARSLMNQYYFSIHSFMGCREKLEQRMPEHQDSSFIKSLRLINQFSTWTIRMKESLVFLSIWKGKHIFFPPHSLPARPAAMKIVEWRKLFCWYQTLKNLCGPQRNSIWKETPLA